MIEHSAWQRARAALATLGLVVAASCGSDPDPESGPGDVAGPASEGPTAWEAEWRDAEGGLGKLFLLDSLGLANIDSSILDARERPTLWVKWPLSQLENLGTAEHPVFALPVNGDSPGGGRPIAELLDASDQVLALATEPVEVRGLPRSGSGAAPNEGDAAEGNAGDEGSVEPAPGEDGAVEGGQGQELAGSEAEGAAPEEPRLAVHRSVRRFEVARHPRYATGFPKPRLPDGSQGVTQTRACTADFELVRAGAETRVKMEARFLSHWTPEVIPTLTFLIDEAQVHRSCMQEDGASAPPSFVLAPAVGTQLLRMEVSDLPTHLTGAEHRLVIQQLVFEEVDGRDKVEIHGLTMDQLEGCSVRVPVQAPDGVISLRASGSEEPVRRMTAFFGGRCAIVSIPSTSLRVTLDGELIADSVNAVQELEFEAPSAGVMDLEVSTSSDTELFLVQPRAALRGELDRTRREEREDSHPLVRHVDVGDDSRRSLLLAAGDEFRFPMPAGEVSQFRSALAAVPLGRSDPAAVAAPVVLPSVRVEWRDGDETQTLWSGRLRPPKWLPCKFRIPPELWGRGELCVKISPAAARPGLSRTVLVALSEPRLIQAPERRPPNVLIYLVDTLRADHLKCYGYERATSSNIDALAADGILFEHAYSQAPWTRPSIASLFTGLLYSFHGAGKTAGLVPRLQTMAETFHDEGYDTAAFISNAQVHARGLNFCQGFQRFHGVEDEAGNSRASDVNRRVLPWLTDNHEHPFFLYVHTLDPHAKYDPPPRTRGAFGSDQYRGSLQPKDTGSINLDKQAPLGAVDAQHVLDLYDEEILFNDQEFGRLIEALKRHEVYDNTVIVFVSDHGEEFAEHGAYGHGGRLWQELLQVPLIVKLAGEDRGRGRRSSVDARVIDIYPTLASYFGFDLEATVHGHDLGPALRGEGQVQAQDVLAEEEPASKTIIRGGKKIIESPRRVRDEPRPARLEPSWTYFDLAEDPGEQDDLYPTRESEAMELLLHLKGTLTQLSTVMAPIRNLLEVKLSEADRERLREMGYLDQVGEEPEDEEPEQE